MPSKPSHCTHSVQSTSLQRPRTIRAAGKPKPIAIERKLLLDYEDVASMTGVPIGTLRRRVARRQGPRLTLVGRHHRFTPADVAEWIEQLRDVTEAA